MKHIEAISKRSLVSDVGKRSWPIPCFDSSSHFGALDLDPSSHVPPVFGVEVITLPRMYLVSRDITC